MKRASPSEPVTGVIRISVDGMRVEPEHEPAGPASMEEAIERLLHERRAPNLAFQPIIDLARGMTVGYEALSRFTGPPQATPDRWFAAAQHIGRAVELEALVIASALTRRDQLPDNCFLSINVAPEALLSSRVQAILSARRLSRLVFELTEHSAVADYDLLARAIAKVRELGGLVAVDDAGAGYASLQHVLLLRPDFVKLDRSLLAGLHRDEAKAALIEMFGGFTSRIDAWLLAEGIEEDDELRRLIQLGVPLGQGYFLGRPDSEMRALDAKLGARIRSTARDKSQRETVGPLAEQALTASIDASAETLQQALAQNPSRTTLILLDALQRPAGIAQCFGTDLRVSRSVMCVLESTTAEAALARALTRREQTRFEPLACCDEQGRTQGVVRIERLIEAALRAR